RRVRRSRFRAGRAGPGATGAVAPGRAAGLADVDRAGRDAVAVARRTGSKPPAGASPRGLRHQVLILAFAGSNPAAPAKRFPRAVFRSIERGCQMTVQDDRSLLVFAGNANRPLAQAVCRELGVRPGKALVGRFSDGEVQVEIEENVRGQDVFVIQPTCAPSAETLVELLVLIDALKRASVASVTAVVPYFGYARQDRRPRSSRVAITAKVAASMFSAVGCDRVLTIDLHADQIQGFFDIPVDNVYASPLLLADIWRAHGTD